MADTSKITLKQLKDAMNKAKNYTDNEIAGITGVSKVEPEELDMPKVFFYGNALPTTKDNVNLTMDYISNTAKFRSFVKLKCQGTSSMSYAKKNFTVTMFSDEARETKLKKDFKGWGAQSKFCLKANYVDTTHTRNISGARIAYDMVNSRPDSPFKQQLLQCPRNGAVDGFPIKLYFNGEFYGIYTWNIPKDGWMFNMDKSNPNHVVLCAERNTDGNSSLINSCQFRKLWTDGDGGDWSVEFGTYSTDMVASFNRCINFVMTATDQEFHDNISNYFDLYSLLDYYCFSYLTCHLDGLAKNMLMATYDGVIWGACLYDMDSIYGVHWNGNSYVATNYQCPEQYQEQFSGLWPRIESCFATELHARYLELRQGALSLSNIIKHVEEIYDVIPDRVFVDEKAKWTSLPQVNTNTITRFRNYMRDRAVYVDAQMEEIGTRVPCTGIVLSADTLSFTTTDTQTLSVVVSPENCTDTIIWSVSPTRIVTVKNGVVTPIRNGEATITATCGSYSDTCAVTVSGMSESGGDTDIYATAEYAITEPRTFNGTSDYIDTGIKLFDTAKTFTIFVDYTTATPTANSQATIFHCIHEEPPYRGLCLMKAQNDDSYFIGGQVNTLPNYTSNIPSNGKYLISFVNGVINNIVTLNNSNELVYSATDMASANPYVQISENLLIGSFQDTSGTKGRYWSGTINKFGVWYKQLTEDEINQVFGKNGGGSDINTNLVFQVNSASMNTTDNTLTDNIAGISATLTGTPTVSGNNIMFTASDSFIFDISSLDLTNSDITVRIKLTQDSLTSTTKNVLTVGSSNSQECWNVSNTVYSVNNNYRFQYGISEELGANNRISDYTIGNFNASNGSNFTKAQVNIEQEIVMSINKNTKDIRIFIDGELVQNGKIYAINNPLYLGNHEGINRFVGGYSLIEIYNGYCNDYTEFTNMVNNASSGGDSGENVNYLKNASWQDGTLNISNTGMTESSDDKYTTIQIPAGKYVLRSPNATWKKYRLNDSEGNVVSYDSGANNANDLIIDTRIFDDTIFTLEVSYYKPNDTIEVPSLTITTAESNVRTLTLDGSLNYAIPDWPDNPSGENGQVNAEYIFSDINTVPSSHILKGYTRNNSLSNVSAKGLAKQYMVSSWNGRVYLSFTLDMAETGVTNDVESIINYLSSNPLTFKYVM